MVQTLISCELCQKTTSLRSLQPAGLTTRIFYLLRVSTVTRVPLLFEPTRNDNGTTRNPLLLVTAVVNHGGHALFVLKVMSTHIVAV